MLRRWLGLLAVLTLALCSLPYGRVSAATGYNTATIGAAQATVQVSLVNHAACTSLLGAGLTGTEIFEESTDGTNWVAVTSFPDAGTSAGATQTVVNPAGGGSYQSNVGGYTYFRVRISAYVSGSNLVTISCNTGPNSAFSVNTAAPSGGGGNVTIVAPTNGAGQVVVSSPAPVTAVSAAICAASGAPCVVPTASPNGGSAEALLPHAVCANNGGTTNCQGVNSANQAYVGAQICNSAVTTCVSPTSSPNGGGAANKIPVGICNNNAGTDNCAAVNATQQLSVTTPAPVVAVSAAICTPTGAPCVSPTASPNGGSALNLLPTAPCGNAAGTTQCAAVAPNGDGTVGSGTYNYRLITASVLYGQNPSSGFDDPIRNAPSPAPTGVPALGYNNLGVAAPAICIQGASQQTASTTAVVLVAAVGAANRIYPCEIDYTITAITAAVATATATVEYGTQTTNPCDTSTVVVKKVSFGSGSITTGILTLSQTIGNGLGIVGPISALNNQMCIVVSSADEQFDVNVTYAAAP